MRSLPGLSKHLRQHKSPSKQTPKLACGKDPDHQISVKGDAIPYHAEGITLGASISGLSGLSNPPYLAAESCNPLSALPGVHKSCVVSSHLQSYFYVASFPPSDK